MLVWKTILRDLYKSGEKDADALDRAVTKGLITEEEKQEILAS